jgi:signal peptidase I
MGEGSELDITRDSLNYVLPCNLRKNSRHPLFFIYKGQSMNPTLWQGDLLEVIPYHRTSIKVGDIIIFNSPHEEEFIAHRVVSISPDGIITKGDNNGHCDQWRLRNSAIIGKVIAATYSMKRRTLREGLLGLLLARSFYSMHEIFRGGCHHMSPIYKFGASRDVLCRLGTLFIKPKIAIFKGNGKSSIMLLSGKHIIGRYNYNINRWNFFKLYRLFIDEDALQDISSIEQE